jgi:hypothetical protein
MKVGPFDVRTLDDCLDIVENAFQSAMWKQLPQDEKTRLIGRLSAILEITEKQELRE